MWNTGTKVDSCQTDTKACKDIGTEMAEQGSIEDLMTEGHTRDPTCRRPKTMRGWAAMMTL